MSGCDTGLCSRRVSDVMHIVSDVTGLGYVRCDTG